MTTSLLILIIILNLVALFLLTQKKNNGNEKILAETIERNNQRLESVLREEFSRSRQESGTLSRQSREEISHSVKSFSDSSNRQLMALADNQHRNFQTFATRLAETTEKNELKLEKVKETIDTHLKSLRQENSEKLEKMRETVDEKLQSTLEKRLGESFKQVGDRLEQVHKGLGEMQNLAIGVGDLKKVLQNVKTRGTWGEVQLGNLLDQILVASQYEKNVPTKKGSNDRVEFAIKIPAKDSKIENIWLPIDAKFPMEDYRALVDAEEKIDLVEMERAAKALEIRVKSEAKDIHDKYLDPPHTTDFGILFLPIEGLYAEVLRRPGLFELLQRDFKVTVVGPTTIAALLNSLQMGFRTLAIEKRSSEVWSVLGKIKTEFGTFGALLDKTQKKLQEASNTIEKASSKSHTIERKLGKVEQLPEADKIGEQTTII